MKQLTVLGSTGSIGCSTLDVVRHNPGRFSVAALVAGKNVDRMVEQCREFTPRYAVMDDAQSVEWLRTRLHEHGCRTEVLSGQQAAAEVAALDEVDQVFDKSLSEQEFDYVIGRLRDQNIEFSDFTAAGHADTAEDENSVMEDSVKAYLHRIGRIPLLSRNQEERLAKEIEMGSQPAKDKMINSNLRLVVSVAKRYAAGSGMALLDLIQEGNIGLMKAVRRFNPEVGVRLVSFAVHWIKAEIHEYVLRNWRIVKVATTKAQRKLFFNLRKTKQRLGWFNQDEVEMVARELGVSSKDVREMESRMAAQDMTFDMSSDDESDSQPMAPVLYLQDKTSNFADGIEDDNWEEQAANKLTDAMQGLDERSQDIIRARWLDEDNKSTLQELADRYGVSAERVRQLEKNAMKKLRAAIEA